MGKTKIQREQAMRNAHKLYLEGISWDKISKKVGYSKSTVQKWKREHNWDGEALKKKSIKKQTPIKNNSSNSENLNEKLIKNFVSLQKVMTNLSSRLDDLGSQISSLLNLFEVSAKSLAEKEVKTQDDEGNEIKEKLNELFEQNRVIARSLTLIHEGNEQGANSQQNMSQAQVPQTNQQMQQNSQQGGNANQFSQNSQITNPSQNPEYKKSTSAQNRFKQLPRS